MKFNTIILTQLTDDFKEFICDKSNKKLCITLIFTAIICFIPLLFSLLGFNFSSTNYTNSLGKPEADSIVFLRQSYAFTILEWSTSIIALLTSFLAFINYKLSKDLTTAIIGFALIFSALFDTFNVILADGLINSVVDNKISIPFLWTMSRLFNSFITVTFILLFQYLNSEKKKTQIEKSHFPIPKDLMVITIISILFGILAVLIIKYCINGNYLPKVLYSDFIISRPFDLIPLVLYIYCGFIALPKFYKKYSMYFTQILLLSMVPHIFTQLHMVFGSTYLYDNHYIIAHLLKIFAYLVPFIGLTMHYTHIYHNDREVIRVKNKIELELKKK